MKSAPSGISEPLAARSRILDTATWGASVKTSRTSRGGLPLDVPDFVLEVIERVAFEAREDLASLAELLGGAALEALLTRVDIRKKLWD